MTITLTKKQLEKRLEECQKHSQNTLSQHCHAYAAEENLIENILQEWSDNEETIEYDEYQWAEYAENLLEDHIQFIYKDWYKGEVEKSPYAWMLFALNNDVWLSDNHMAEETIKMGWELPQWYKDEYMEEEED